MNIYGDIKSGNCLKVKFVADYLNIPYDWTSIDVLNNETKTEYFLALNPVGQIPVIQLKNGSCLSQSNAIIRYLSQNSDLVYFDAFMNAKIDEWLFWEQYSHEPALAVLRFKIFYEKMDSSEIDPSLHKKTLKALRIMDNHLQKNKYFTGSKMTIADISLLAYTRMSGDAKIEIGQYSSIARWIADCEKHLKLEPYKT
ncbi:glutathione S-transferase family protein [bacterium]|nr:glutathione S-transferase family protein [bacterium]